MVQKSCLAFLAVLVLFGGDSSSSQATTMVRFETTLGNFDVQLYDDDTPISVANFLSYVTTDRWDGTIVHRTVDDFVIQGGGYSLDPDIFNTTPVTTDAAIQNESLFSNVRGTIAYARTSDPNSATSQWFINLKDNLFLDGNSSSGYAVFGHIVDNGMDVVDAIAALERVDYGVPFGEVPVLDKDKVDSQGNIFAGDAVIVLDVFEVPEPASLSLVGVGCLLALRVGARRRSRVLS